MTTQRKNKGVISVDRDYVPMQIVDRQHAFTAVSSERALILDPKTWRTYGLEDYPNWPPIQIIVFPHTRAYSESRLNLGPGGILKRDNWECQYIVNGVPCPNKGDTLDHVIPKSKVKGGGTTWNNLVACCKPCNSRKADHLMGEVGMRLKRPIKSPKWLLYEQFQTLCNGWERG